MAVRRLYALRKMVFARPPPGPQKDPARHRDIVKRLVGTVVGMTLTYGLYRTALVGQPSYVNRANNQSSATKSTITDPPFHTGFHEPMSPPPVDVPDQAKPQPNIYSHDKEHTLFLWIRLKNKAKRDKVAAATTKLQALVAQVEAPYASECGNHHILAGVGFGPELYQQVAGGAPQPFSNAKQDLLSGQMAAVGGDLLVHAKANKQEMLRQLVNAFLKALPLNSVQSQVETYARHAFPETVKRRHAGSEPLNIVNYQFTDGKMQLQPTPRHRHPGKGGKGGGSNSKSGSHGKGAHGNENGKHGKEHKKDKKALMFVSHSGRLDTSPYRRQAAVEAETGGSYAMTHMWEHDINKLIQITKDQHHEAAKKGVKPGESQLNKKKSSDPDEVEEIACYLNRHRDKICDGGEKTMNSWVDQALELCGRPLGKSRFRSLPELGADYANHSLQQWVQIACSECEATQKEHQGEVLCTPGHNETGTEFKMLRQSLPYRGPGATTGLFFISFTSSPRHNEMLLNRLVASVSGGTQPNSTAPEVFHLSHNVQSACWYFPSMEELAKLAKI